MTELVAESENLHPVWLKAAFLLFVVGYGTKMGLVPLHTWLPDAHSEAPSRRVRAALGRAAELRLSRDPPDALHPGGRRPRTLQQRTCSSASVILSVVAAAAFLVRQSDYKRMLAYSSVEHMGLLALGAGLGGAGALPPSCTRATTRWPRACSFSRQATS